MSNELWTQEEFDTLLNEVLPADSYERMVGLCDLVGRRLGRDGDAVMRIMWGLALRITKIDYTPSPTRTPRKLPTFADIQMIKWATRGKSKDVRRKAGPADSEYMARVLMLPIETVEKMWMEYGPAQGRQGFQLKSLHIKAEND